MKPQIVQYAGVDHKCCEGKIGAICLDWRSKNYLIPLLFANAQN